MRRELGDPVAFSGFSLGQIAALPLGFFAVIFALNKIVRFVCLHVAAFDCPRYWPLSVFDRRLPTAGNVLVALGVSLCFVAGVRWLARRHFPLAPTIAFGVLLILGSNGVQGWQNGFVTPVAGGGAHGIQYYHDAQAITSPAAFLRDFNAIQPTLHDHARTHPPGAVLVFWALDRLLPGPAAISVALAILSGTLLAAFFHGILREALGDDEFARGLTLLLLLLPAVQIYTAATLDALIAALLLGALYFYVSPPTVTRTALAAVCVVLVALLTFGFVWVLPVLLAIDAQRRSFGRIGIVLLALVVAVGLLQALFGFHYLAALQTASRLENPAGFRLLSSPLSYGFTRIEDVLEIAVFAGPFVLALAGRGLAPLRQQAPVLFGATVAGGLTLLALFLAGAFRTGETARACLFFAPYLLFPVAATSKALETTAREPAWLLLSLVFAQTLWMQLFGFYFW